MQRSGLKGPPDKEQFSGSYSETRKRLTIPCAYVRNLQCKGGKVISVQVQSDTKAELG